MIGDGAVSGGGTTCGGGCSARGSCSLLWEEKGGRRGGREEVANNPATYHWCRSCKTPKNHTEANSENRIDFQEPAGQKPRIGLGGNLAIEIRISDDDWDGAVSGEGHVRRGLLRLGDGALRRRVGEGDL